MIKLIITSDTADTITRRFSQASVVIGGDYALDADLKLSGQSLQDRHIQIIRQAEENKTCFYVINLANDPFVTLNNLPFGKQPLYSNDLIQVGDISLRFEYELEARLEEPSLFDSLIRNDKSFQNKSLGYARSDHHPDQTTQEDFDPLDRNRRKSPGNFEDCAVKPGVAADLAYPYTKNPPLPLSEKSNPTSASPSSSKSPKLSLKDYYLSEYDDDEDAPVSKLEKNTNQFHAPQFTKSWRSYLSILVGITGLLLVAISVAYLWVSDQTEGEEGIAAKGVSDIAMALTYAQLKHIHPQNQNWSYPDFIKNNLTPVLAPGYISLADIDSHGQFANCPYMLRVHTSSDLSQFLVIAQPCPSLLQWLVPKASIIVDSLVMEMRKITDLKPLNRLIVNSNNLDGINANEISNLVKQGDLIPLSSLVSKAENQGLAPPKVLGLIRPGAENMIYNAPRYYLLGETILNSSLDLADKYAGVKEASILQQELNSILKFQDFVFYTSDGIQHALKAQKAMAEFIPNDKFLIACLQLNVHGKIANALLLMDNTPSDIAIGEKNINKAKDDNDFASGLDSKNDFSTPLQGENDAKGLTEEKSIQDVDSENPLFIQLTGIAKLRQIALKPLASETIMLVKKQTLSAQADFPIRLAKLQQKYLEADLNEQAKLFKKFGTIIHDNTHLPAAKFLEYFQATNLKNAFEDYLLNLKKQSKEQQVTDEQIAKQFHIIQASTSWQELEKNTAQINQMLQFNRVSDADRLITLQNSTRSMVTQKLNQFILSSSEALPSNAFNPDYLETLTHILKAVWITDPSTHDFYIAEFELREPHSKE